MVPRHLAVLAVCGISLLSLGCDGTTKITYRQELSFNVFDPDPAATPHNTYGGGHVMVRILSIDNSDRKDVFNFDPAKMYYMNQTNGGWNFSGQDNLLAAPWRQGPETVGIGQVLSTGLGCVIHSAPGLGTQDVVFLNYASSGSESVALVRVGEVPSQDNPSPDLGFTYVNTAFPNTLQSNCN